MASELTVTILRYAFLALIWFFVFLVVSAARRDLGLGKNYFTPISTPASPVWQTPARSLYLLCPYIKYSLHFGLGPFFKLPSGGCTRHNGVTNHAECICLRYAALSPRHPAM